MRESVQSYALIQVLFAGQGAVRERCRSLDWKHTPLGEVASWPASLRTAAVTVLGAGFPMVMLWGPALAQIFNDSYLPFLGAKGVGALGQPTRDCSPDEWHFHARFYERALLGETVTLHEAHFPVQRRGPKEPADDLYLTLSYSPLPDDDGGIGGVLITLIDVTAQVVGRAIQAERDGLASQLHGALLEAGLVLDRTRDAYLLLDEEFRIVTLNPSAERLLGRTRVDLVGQQHWNTTPGRMSAEIERQFRRVAAERVESHFAHEYCGDDAELQFEIDTYPASGGRIAMFLRDVSERVRLEAAAKAARIDAESRAATLSAIVQSVPDALLVARRDGVLLTNPVALDELGVQSPAALRTGLLEGVAPLEEMLLDRASGATLPLEATPIGRAFSGERSHGHFLLHARSASEAARPVRAAAAPIIGPEGEVSGVVTVLTDMTSVERAAAERERLLRALDVERGRLAYVFQQAPAFLAIMRGPTHVFELANDAYYRLVGARDLIGKAAAEALPEVRDQGFLELVDRVLATGEPYVGREVAIRLARSLDSEAETRFVDFVYLPLVEADGTRTGVIAHGTDVTEHVHARQEIERLLRDSECARIDAVRARERTASLAALTSALSSIHSARDCVDVIVQHTTSIFGAAGTIVAGVTPDGAALELLGASALSEEARQEWLRFPLSAPVPLAEAARSQSPIFLESRDDWDTRYPHLMNLVDVTGHQANAVLPLVLDGRTLGVVGVAFQTPRIFDDEDRAIALTLARQCAQSMERVRLFEAEHAARRDAEAANRAKSEFLAIMSHELRTPLNAIDGYAELIELGVRGPVTDEQRQDLARIRKSEKHLLGLINGVLNYAQVEAGAVHYDLERIPLEEVLSTCEALTAPQTRAKRLTLDRAPCEPTMIVHADREKLQQVLLNLLSNAIKFTEAGGRIDVRCEQRHHVRGSDVHIDVTDTGIGIATTQLQRIFEPFVQVNSELTRTRQGTGLGLAISRDLARGMGGELSVSSTPGRGSTFSLTLPAG